MTYTPRTQSKKFLDGDCPAGVLAIYDNGGKTFDRYTVFYRPTEQQHYTRGYIDYRAMSERPSSPQGFGIYGEMTPFQARQYRGSVYRHSARWTDLPAEVQKTVIRDCADILAGVEND